MNVDYKCAVIDLGGTRARLGCFSSKSKLVTTTTYRIDQYGNPRELFEAVKDDNPDIASIPWVLGVPSPVRKNRTAETPNLGTGWQGDAITDALEDLDISYELENDANLAVLGEYSHGSGQGHQNLVCLTLGTGIGGGIIINGDLYRGNSGAAGEIGHITLVPGGRPCGCGNRGCFEQYGSASGLVKTYEQLTGDQLPADEIADRFPGDDNAKKAFQATGTHLGRGIAIVCNILEPGRIILAGGLSMSFEYFRDDLVEAFQETIFAERVRQTDVVPSDLEEPALYGGLALCESEA
ncbi:MAG: ROK family protein [bacterium]